MKERVVAWFPYVIAIVLPLAGLFMALWRLVEGDRLTAAYLAMVSLLAGLIWVLALGL